MGLSYFLTSNQRFIDKFVFYRRKSTHKYTSIMESEKIDLKLSDPIKLSLCMKHKFREQRNTASKDISKM